MIEIAPRLWSDFDGTAVGIAKKTNPRNWSKYPLPGIVGYADFLRGVQSTGVEIAGIVSRRPDMFIRRFATGLSVHTLGYQEFFDEPKKIVHAGSEKAKGQFVVEQSKATVIGILEDKPHKLGAVMLGALKEARVHPKTAHNPIVMGVVSHDKSQENLERMAESAAAAQHRDLDIIELDSSETGINGFCFELESLRLAVVQLRPYSLESGKEFGQMLLDEAAI
jgi:hypothetical protein